jgi:hypothetical protein
MFENEWENPLTGAEYAEKGRRVLAAFEIIEYIKAYPENFFESLDCGVCAEEEPIFRVLEDFAEWDSLRFSEWRGERDAEL